MRIERPELDRLMSAVVAAEQSLADENGIPGNIRMSSREDCEAAVLGLLSMRQGTFVACSEVAAPVAPHPMVVTNERTSLPAKPATPWDQNAGAPEPTRPAV
jgi:hypothetical protein